ncbi:hypothetical protein [Actinomadura coerulea]|uniref:hypothetical protein n=1 Tax=Actinomadura coerulea TaxID=46159 RepID=UPI00342E6E9A
MALIGYRYFKEDEYRQSIRRFPPSFFLPLVAQAATRAMEQRLARKNPAKRLHEWALADMARVSLAFGNEYRSHQPTMQDINVIHGMYLEMADPFVDEPPVTHLLRLAGQQLDWQVDHYQSQARTMAILGHTSTSKSLEVLNTGWEQELLGCSLSEYVAAVRLAFVIAVHHGGRSIPMCSADRTLGNCSGRSAGRLFSRSSISTSSLTRRPSKQTTNMPALPPTNDPT